jgi:hypothetical protein
MTKANPTPPAALVRLRFNYDPLSGIFLWRAHRSKTLIGELAGSLRPDGYVFLRFDGYQMLGHRAAWVYVHGDISDTLTINHINGIPHDNRLANLRLVAQAISCQNREVTDSDGITKMGSRWRAHGGPNHLGMFDTKKQAAKAVRQWKIENYPGYTGRRSG